MAEKYYGQSSYNYVYNIPINLIDPNGMQGEDWFLTGDNQYIYVDGASAFDLRGSGLTWVSDAGMDATMIRDGSIMGEEHYAYT